MLPDLPSFQKLTLFGAELDAGASRRGASMGPAALRIAGLATVLAELGHPVEDRGDIVPVPIPPQAITSEKLFAHNLEEIAGWVRAIRLVASDTLHAGQVPILLGGDHSVAMGSGAAAAHFAAQQNRPLFVLWLDAHADFNTPQTSPSGNVHGMALAALCGEKGLETIYSDPSQPKVRPDHVHLFGIRQIDRGERRLLLDRGIDVVDMSMIDELGVAVPLQRILDRVKAANGLLHVSFDADFLDPSIAPGIGTPVNGGATYREAHLIMEMLFDSGLVTSLDIVELNAFLDESGKTAHLLVDLIGSLFGRKVFVRRSVTRGSYM